MIERNRKVLNGEKMELPMLIFMGGGYAVIDHQWMPSLIFWKQEASLMIHLRIIDSSP